MDGIRRTDAGWVKRGTRPLAPGGRVSRWTLMPRAQRASARLAATASLAALGWGELEHPHGTEQAVTGVAVAAATGATGAAVRGALLWRHRREWVKPLHVALEKPLGLPEGTVPGSYLHIPRDYPTRTDVGTIDLPPDYTGHAGTAESVISGIIKTKLGLSDVSVSYKLAGRKPHLVITQTPRPPAKVMFAAPETRALVEKAAESAPLIGLGPMSRVVSVDMDSESPHILVSASTGGGKSVITRAMTTQVLHRGGQAVVLDFKLHSHKWAQGLPSVDYRKRVHEIHDALVELGEEGHRRNEIVDRWSEAGDPDVGPRKVILLEEANATISKLKRHWAAVRNPKFDPKESPAIDALREILFMGRAVKMHVLLVAQSATAAALGGPEVRECFSTRILARYTRNAWMMLVPEVQPIPRSTRHVGRAQVVLGGVASETQVVFFSDAEARAWALSGTVVPLDQDQDQAEPLTAAEGVTSQGHSIPTPRVTSDDEESVYVTEPGVTRPVLTLVKGGPDAPAVPPMPKNPPTIPRYSLAAASREGIVPMTADALRQAKRRDDSFPAGIDGKFTADELTAWFDARKKAAEESDSESAV